MVFLNQLKDSPGGSAEDVRGAFPQGLHILLLGLPAGKVINLDVRHVLGQPLEFLHDLEGQLTGVGKGQDENFTLFVFLDIQLLKDGDNEDRGFSHSGLGLAKKISA